MSLCETKRQQVLGILAGAIVVISITIMGTIASLRVETQFNESIQRRQLEALMDAATVTDWCPLAEIQWIEFRFAMLLLLSVVLSGWGFVRVTRRRIISRKEVALVAILNVVMAAMSVYNFYGLCVTPCLHQVASAGLPTPPDAEPRLNRLLCSAWCHATTTTNANASTVSSCGPPPTAVAKEYAARMNITDWCIRTTQPLLVDSNTTNALHWAAVPPFSQLHSSLECPPLDGWQATLVVMIALMVGVFAIQLTAVGVFLLEKNIARSEAATAECTKPDIALAEKLVNV